MIIWIASYPKSGNTFVRLLLSSYFNNFKNSNNLLESLNYQGEVYPGLNFFLDTNYLITNSLTFDNCVNALIEYQSVLSNKSTFYPVKTHLINFEHENEMFLKKKNSLASIYIIRDPRNVCLSLMHFSNLSFEETISYLKNDTYNFDYLNNIKIQHTRLGSWKDNVLSWKKTNIYFPVLFVKYEELVQNTFSEFLKIINFLKKFINIEPDPIRINNIVSDCTFDKVKSLENKYGFQEASINNFTKNKINFFDKGPDRNYLKELNKKELDFINLNLSDEIKLYNSI